MRLTDWIAKRFAYTRVVDGICASQERYIQVLEREVDALAAHLPDTSGLTHIGMLKAFRQPADDIGTLLAACIDYRNLLIRAYVPDSVSGRSEGLEDICRRYGIKLDARVNAFGQQVTND